MLQFVLGFFSCALITLGIRAWDNRTTQQSYNEIIKTQQNIKLLIDEAIQVSNILGSDISQKVEEGKLLLEHLENIIQKVKSVETNKSEEKCLKPIVIEKKPKKSSGSEIIQKPTVKSKYEILMDLNIEDVSIKDIAQNYNMGQDEVRMILGLIDLQRKKIAN